MKSRQGKRDVIVNRTMFYNSNSQPHPVKKIITILVNTVEPRPTSLATYFPHFNTNAP